MTAEVPTLETDRLILREIQERDFSDFHALFSDPGVNEHIQLDWAEPAQARKMFDSFKNRHPEGRGIRWSITLKADGQWIGNFGFHNLRPEQGLIERGLQIASSHWRKGYGFEASQTAMRWLARETRFKKVDAWVTVGNTAAIGLIERQGFSDTGDRKTLNGLGLARFEIAL